MRQGSRFNIWLTLSAVISLEIWYNQKMRTILFLASLLAIFILSACSASIEMPEEATPTQSELAFATPTLPPTATPQVANTPAPPTAVPTSAPISGLTSARVNVRSGPDANSESLGILQTASQVQVIGRDGNGQWLAIAFAQSPNGIGWVTAQFIELAGDVERLSILVDAQPEQTVLATSEPEPSQPEPEPPAGEPQRTARTTSRINVRGGPASSFDAIAIMDANTTVVLTGRNQSMTWVQIEFPDGPEGRAWIAVAYIEYEGFFLDSLPAFDNQGQPIQPPSQAGIGQPEATPSEDGYQPAVDDMDSADNPAVRLSFSPAGTRRIIYASDLSAPTGDRADWIEFTLITPQSGQAVFIYFKLECSGNGAISTEMRQNGLLVSEFPGLLCGQYGVPFKALSGVPYLLQLQADGSASEVRYVAYHLYISTTP
jgi:uncharacterized protein YraI